jgi:hypothetical protein
MLTIAKLRLAAKINSNWMTRGRCPGGREVNIAGDGISRNMTPNSHSTGFGGMAGTSAQAHAIVSAAREGSNSEHWMARSKRRFCERGSRRRSPSASCRLSSIRDFVILTSRRCVWVSSEMTFRTTRRRPRASQVTKV